MTQSVSIVPDAANPYRTLEVTHSPNLPELLATLGVTVAITTYDGELVLLRAQGSPGGPRLGMQVQRFDLPSGMAWDRKRLVLGTRYAIWEFHDVPEAAQALRMPTDMVCDAYLMPRQMNFTADVQTHELAFAAPPDLDSPRTHDAADPIGLSELWFVSTRFSCLATRSNVFHFTPRWMPPFITDFKPEDRCHLNGIGIRDGQPRYATALGATDTPAGWRERKRDGGILMQVPTGHIIAGNLSLPHSPRWYQQKLWLLESGKGSLCTIDEATGQSQEVIRMPGVTRGLGFHDHYAFVGLSQIRNTNVFIDVPSVQTSLTERWSGLWVIDLNTGRLAAFLRFTTIVHELFSVLVLPGIRWPILDRDPEHIARFVRVPDPSPALARTWEAHWEKDRL